MEAWTEAVDRDSPDLRQHPTAQDRERRGNPDHHEDDQEEPQCRLHAAARAGHPELQ